MKERNHALNSLSRSLALSLLSFPGQFSFFCEGRAFHSRLKLPPQRRTADPPDRTSVARTQSPFIVSLWGICVGVCRRRILAIFLTFSVTQRCSPTCLTSTPLVTSSSPFLSSHGQALTQAPSPRSPSPQGVYLGGDHGAHGAPLLFCVGRKYPQQTG